MSPFPTSKGHLNPGGPVSMTRLPAGADAADLVRHYWIPEWDLPAGRAYRQVVLGYPACNLVVEGDAVTLAGPTTRVSYRDLAGRGWAVGALLRPAACPLVLAAGGFRSEVADAGGHRAGPAGRPTAVADCVDRELAGATDALAGTVRAVVSAMSRGDRDAAVAAMERFLLTLRPAVTAEGLLANRIQQVVEGSDVRRVDDIAAAVAVSSRTLQRLTRQYLGVSPAAMVRRRRLQDAADVVRRDPTVDLAEVAAAHGYADHAHLTREFREVLGFTPSQYRTGATECGDLP